MMRGNKCVFVSCVSFSPCWLLSRERGVPPARGPFPKSGFPEYFSKVKLSRNMLLTLMVSWCC